MITLIIKHYFFLLLSLTMSAVLLFLLSIYFIVKRNRAKKNFTNYESFILKDHVVSLHTANEEKSEHESHEAIDVDLIAGDDICGTQLDLARAYIEAGKDILAKNILQTVMAKGNDSQQQEAKYLLSML